MDTFTIDPPIQTNAFDELFPFLVEKTPHIMLMWFLKTATSLF